MRRCRFVQLDVFTTTPFEGNPLAVFPDADGLSGEEMQRVAREMNLSESTFVLPPTTPDAYARVRIFTPYEELPYAGHPSVGTHWLLAEEGRLEVKAGARVRVTQEVGAGLLPIDVDADADGRPVQVLSTQRPPRFGPAVEARAELAGGLGLALGDLHDPDLPARVVDTGVPWLLVPLRDEKALARVRAQPAAFEELRDAVGTHHLYPFCLTPDRDALTLARGILVGEFEDPVTGSASGCLGAYVAQYGLATPDADGVVRYEHRQGAFVGRPGRVRVEVPVAADGTVGSPRVGGACVRVAEGHVLLP